MNAHRPVVDDFAGLPKPEIIPHFPGTAFLPTYREILPSCSAKEIIACCQHVDS